jgi:hypothetical protein
MILYLNWFLKIWRRGLQVLVVRQDLKMGAGKIASQCARKLHLLDSWYQHFFLDTSLSVRLILTWQSHFAQIELIACLFCNNQIPARANLV